MDDINYEDRWIGKVKRFNKNFPVGTPVVFIKDNGKQLHTRIEHPAIMLNDRCPVVWVENIKTRVRFDRVIVK